MTANQLAYAANQETERHNRATEKEIERHQKRTDEINQYIAENDAYHKERQDALTKQYNDAYEKSVTAEAKYKEEYIALMRDIEQQKVDNEAERNAINKQYNNDLIRENNRHNVEQENIDKEGNRIKDLQVKMAKYAADVSYASSIYHSDVLKYNNTINAINDSFRIQATIIKNNADILLGQGHLANETARTKGQLEVWSSEIAKNYSKAWKEFNQGNSALVDTIRKIGATNVPKASKITWSDVQNEFGKQ